MDFTSPLRDAAIGRIVRNHPDVVLLDVNLPGMDGFSICRAVRPNYHGVIIMLTAQGEEVDEVLGLESLDTVTDERDELVGTRVMSPMSAASVPPVASRRYKPIQTDTRSQQTARRDRNRMSAVAIKPDGSEAPRNTRNEDGKR